MSAIKAAPWVGAVNENQATVKAAILNSANKIEMAFGKNASVPNKVKPDTVEEVTNRDFNVVTFKPTDLEASTRYFYEIRTGSDLKKGSFKTFPKAGEKAEFRFGLASCSNRLSLFPKVSVYNEIVKEPDLLFFCHMGDLHYGDLKDELPEQRIDKYIETLERRGIKELFPNLPVAHIWDDHDFLGNNSGGGDSNKRPFAMNALKAFDLFVPHYDFGNKDDGVYQSFLVGNVLFVLTDTRHNRTTDTKETMLGSKQKAWLKEKLLEGKERDLIIWVNSVPWIGDASLLRPWRYIFNRDTWYAFKDERTEVAQFIKDNEITNLCMLSGDAHMLAIDDGSHSGYAENSKGGFPVFQAAALDSLWSFKGGPYSKGKKGNRPGYGIAGRGHYGVFEVTYENGELNAHWQGKRVKKEGDVRIRITHDFKSPGTFAEF